ERQKLIDDPSLIPAAAEEMVRLVSPVRTFRRTLTQDYDYEGHAMKKGDEVCIVYPAANRDPRTFDAPDSFRVDRNPQHLGFGIGSHFCLGANLARMEMRVAFEEALKRLPDMAYSRGGPEFRASTLVRSCMHMWVSYTPDSKAA
ncbi:MAG: cytochrome P450, partial [Phycisphaeraceae bacterium]|nr:cytochrome P450 [Phycisphaeraceae bacterium]